MKLFLLLVAAILMISQSVVASPTEDMPDLNAGQRWFDQYYYKPTKVCKEIVKKKCEKVPFKKCVIDYKEECKDVKEKVCKKIFVKVKVDKHHKHHGW